MPAAKQLHRWDVSYEEAVAIQNKLRQEVGFSPLRRVVKTVAGADVSFDKQSNKIYAAIAVLSFPSLQPVEQAIVEGKSKFPYIPGLLSFREAPIVAEAFEKLSAKPDVLMCDGQGVAHPRGLGLACHLGLLFDIPSIGCAKSRLCGTHGEVGPEAGDYAPLKLRGRTVGAVLRTRKGVKPVFVSVGHMINLRGAIRLTIRCGTGYRIPEPTRAAHHLVTCARTGEKPSWPRRKR
ncbi:MAG: deoxyribonuclease V [Candidatus Abyssubacteria bacterium]|nr:deoxyribonuclease V [Candidatus Abyssubacteria bacterium]